MQMECVMRYPYLSIQINDCAGGSGSNINYNKLVYQIKIPFAGNLLTWEILFSEDESIPPDFIFDEGDEFAADYFKVDSLEKWNLLKEASLLFIIMELLDHYKEYQETKRTLVLNGTTKKELVKLEGKKGLESIVNDSLRKVHLSIPLEIDHDKMNRFKKRKYDAIYDKDSRLVESRFKDFKLDLSFNVGSLKPTSIKISPPATFSVPEDVMEVPEWTDKMDVTKLVSTTKELLSANLSNFEIRYRFIQSMIKAFGPPLEFDDYEHKKITMLLKKDGRASVVSFTLREDFPANQPKITFYNIASTKKNSELGEITVGGDYPWSPRWNTDEMAKRIKDWISSSFDWKRVDKSIV
eukprot:TRINITY_DN1592_c0_g1_i1.p1 TRINITY_DN1592_c0_g1~~TRINITY_DN1592_c0_g1_i1.p1  ORF type:complete len:374 (+),score=129.97 TRINITY_DN1592_c0_g1_i1:66-1124(+)